MRLPILWTGRWNGDSLDVTRIRDVVVYYFDEGDSVTVHCQLSANSNEPRHVLTLRNRDLIHFLEAVSKFGVRE